MITKSCVVRSNAGRDQGKLFLVLSLDEEGYALIADGRHRRTEKPKRKKQKHLEYVAENHTRTREKILNDEPLTNLEVRRAIALYQPVDRESQE